MIAFDIYLNDQKLCRAGIGDSGVLSAIVTWAATTMPTGTRNESLFLNMGGLINPEGNHVSWINQKGLTVGDRIKSTSLKQIRLMNIRDANWKRMRGCVRPRKIRFAGPQKNWDGNLKSLQSRPASLVEKAKGCAWPYATAPAASAAPNATTFPGPCTNDVASACSARLITSVTMSMGS